MLLTPSFLKPRKNLVRLLRIHTGHISNISINKLIKSVNLYKSPLPLVFLLATAIYKIDKSQLPKQLAGVISHEKIGNAMNMAAFQKILKLYSEHNIPVMAQKGLVAKLLYPQSTRPMNDVDFYVPRHLYRSAINLAVENGFHINHDMLCSADLQLRDQGCVDIHYALFKGANPRMDDTIFHRAQQTQFAGTEVLIPTPEDRLIIIMCEFYGNFLFEAGSKGTDIRQIFAAHPQWVLDTYKIIHENPGLNWGRIMRTAKMSEYDYQIKLLTRLLNNIIPGLISKHATNIIDFLCPDKTVKKYLKRDKKIVYLHKKNYKIFLDERY